MSGRKSEAGRGRRRLGRAAWLAGMLLLVLCGVSTLHAGQDEFPRERLENLDGAAVTLGDSAGAALTVLDFWALWCAPCQQAIPELRELARRMEKYPVRFRFINCDNTRGRSKVRSFSQSKGVAAEVLLDPSQNLMRRYGISSLPHLVVLDSLGHVVDRKAGYMLGDYQALEKKLLELLGR